jgi:anaerobic ribonucleoside-triphosphate reductase activating protein
MKDYGNAFNLSHIEPTSQIYGPGKRFVVWFQGCSLACDGCWNQDMWSFKDNVLIQKEDLLNRILSASDIEGITFLGGEPLHQAENIWWLMCQIRKHSDLTIFLFTGYEHAELQQLGHLSNIHELCDMVAIGRYQEADRNTNQQWIGSDNQVIIYPVRSRELTKPESINQVEIIIEDNESLRILGFPDDALVNEFK